MNAYQAFHKDLQIQYLWAGDKKERKRVSLPWWEFQPGLHFVVLPHQTCWRWQGQLEHSCLALLHNWWAQQGLCLKWRESKHSWNRWASMWLRIGSQSHLSNKTLVFNSCTNRRGLRNLCTNKAHLLSSTTHLLTSSQNATLVLEGSTDSTEKKARWMHLYQGWIQPLLCKDISLCDDKWKLTCSRDENSHFNFVLSGLVLTFNNSIIQQMLGAAQLQSFKKILDFDVRTSSKYVREKLKVKYLRFYFPI